MTSINDTVNTQFSDVFTSLSDISTRTKSLTDSLRILQRTLKTAPKQVRTNQTKNQEPMMLSKELEKFLTVEHGTQLTKAQVMKSVSEYIKVNNLQLEANKRKFKPDTKLTKVFQMKKGTEFTFVEINKHVSGHMTKSPTPVVTTTTSA